jgi:hypothetical protein
MRELPPLTTRNDHVENGIENANHVGGAGSASRFSQRDQWLQEFPLVYCQVTIVCFFHCSQDSVVDCSLTDYPLESLPDFSNSLSSLKPCFRANSCASGMEERLYPVRSLAESIRQRLQYLDGSAIVPPLLTFVELSIHYGTRQ